MCPPPHASRWQSLPEIDVRGSVDARDVLIGPITYPKPPGGGERGAQTAAGPKSAARTPAPGTPAQGETGPEKDTTTRRHDTAGPEHGTGRAAPPQRHARPEHRGRARPEGRPETRERTALEREGSRGKARTPASRPGTTAPGNCGQERNGGKERGPWDVLIVGPTAIAPRRA